MTLPPRFRSRPLVLGLALPLALASAAAAQGDVDHPYYIGSGYVREMSADLGRFHWAGFFQGDGDGLFELAALHENGTLTIHERFASYDTRLEVADCTHAAVLKAAGSDRLFAVRQDELVELTRAVDPHAWVPAAVPGVDLQDISGLIEVDRGEDSVLLVIDKGGERVVTLQPGDPWVSHALHVDPADAPILDAEQLDWDGDGAADLALMTTGGLRVFDAGGASLYVQHVPADRAFVDVLRAEDTAGDRDYLLHHHRVAEGAPAVLDVIHASHFQQIYVDPLLLESAVVADFSAADYSEVLLPGGFDQSVILLEQNYAAPGAPMVLVLNQGGVQVINLDPGHELPPSVPDWAPASAVADLDGDGDEDLVFVDQRGQGFVVTSANVDEVDRYCGEINVLPLQSLTGDDGSSAHFYCSELVLPDGADAAVVEIWYSDSPDSTNPAQQVATGTFSAQGQPLVPFCILFAELPSPDGVYYFLRRPTSEDPNEPPFPAYVSVWTPSPDFTDDLLAFPSELYVWPPVFPAHIGGGTGGTTQRPVVPGPPVPPTPSGD